MYGELLVMSMRILSSGDESVKSNCGDNSTYQLKKSLNCTLKMDEFYGM